MIQRREWMVRSLLGLTAGGSLSGSLVRWLANPLVNSLRTPLGQATALGSLIGCSTGCDDNSLPSTSPNMARRRGVEPISVVATVGMVADLIRQLGGDQVDVFQLMGAGVDPHLYKGTRDDVRFILASDLVFYSGLMLEGKLTHMLEKVASRKPVVPITRQLDTNQLLGDAEALDHADPHVWMDVAAWSTCLQTIHQTLCQFDPEHSETYQSAHDTYSKQLRALHEYGQQVMSTVPERGRVLITSHDAFQYFGRAYRVEVFGVQGLATDSEAGLTQINSLVSLIVERQVQAVFVESSVPQKSVRAVIDGAAARGHRVQLGGVLFSDAMGPAGTYEGTYVGMMDHNLTTVARALGGEAPERGFQGKLSTRAEVT